MLRLPPEIVVDSTSTRIFKYVRYILSQTSRIQQGVYRMMVLAWIVFFLVVVGALSFNRASLAVWTIGIALFLLLCSYFSPFHVAVLTVFWVIFAAIFIPLNIRPLRRMLLSQYIFKIYRKVMPALSDTEREALTAGNVSYEAELFSGMPDWDKLEKTKLSKLSADERAFMEGPVEELCEMINSFEMNLKMDLPNDVLQFLRDKGFLGMIIPKKYGGLEFSNYGHAQVITKIASASCVAGILTSVPNSLGPAELLLHYGTEEQKNHYLPRLASGKDIPCFALTSPTAGSDAGSIEDYGVVCEAEFEGKKQLCIRLNWNKRYITLAPVATLIGLAFKLYDPDHLLGNKESLGITCALIPKDVKNVEIGRRHMPLVSAFPNGPTQGKDVIVPIDYIIGGAKMAGQGWRMLMECLAAGRAISLPSMVTGGVRMATLATGAYGRIRSQFNMPIANFGGVEEALTRIVSNAYAMESVRTFTVSALDQGKRPAVASAIAKYHCTEMSRRVLNDAMDIHGGKGICMGPSNYLAQGHIEMPISITVEGANILTRSMIIFGQGVIRCHPYVLDEMMASMDNNEKSALKAFDRAFFSHLGFVSSNKMRAFVLGLTNGRWASAPKGPLKRYYQQFSRFSAALAFLADMAMMTMGGELKRAEKLSARYGDVLSYLYIGASVLRFYNEGNNKSDELPLVQWICEDLLFKMQSQLDGLLRNFPDSFLRKTLRWVVFPRGRYLRAPSDRLGRKVAKLITDSNDFRERIAKDLYYTPNENNPIAQLEDVLHRVIANEPLEKRLAAAKKEGRISGMTREEQLDAAVAESLISKEEADLMRDTFAMKMKVVNVDDFGDEIIRQ